MAYGPQRREPRRFEPPPWEREQFGSFEQERAGEALPEVPESAVPQTGQGAGPRVEPPPGPGTPQAEPPGVDAMLLALKAEEPVAVEGAWKFGLIAAAFVGTIGLMLVIWGTVAFARSAGSGPAGIMGATIMSVMGGSFVGLAAWMGARSLKQRGVL